MKSKKKTILIIEDELELLGVLKDKFIGEGFKVIKAVNGKEGVKAALTKRPDLILLDIIMPVMDGMTALEKIRADKRGAQIHVILLTNLSDIEKEKTARSKGVNDYLIKTDWSLADVVKKVKNKLKK